MSKQAFAEWLRQKLEERGIKPSQLAAYLELDHVSVLNWLKGKHLPESGNAIKVADYFRVDTDFVLELAGHRRAQREALDLASPELRLVLRKVATLPPEDQRLILDIVRPIIERDERLRKERERRKPGGEG